MSTRRNTGDWMTVLVFLLPAKLHDVATSCKLVKVLCNLASSQIEQQSVNVAFQVFEDFVLHRNACYIQTYADADSKYTLTHCENKPFWSCTTLKSFQINTYINCLESLFLRDQWTFGQVRTCLSICFKTSVLQSVQYFLCDQ